MENKYETVLHTSSYDDRSVVVDFDLWDNNLLQIADQTGYAHIKLNDKAECLTVAVYDHNGMPVSETRIPYRFENVDY